MMRAFLVMLICGTCGLLFSQTDSTAGLRAYELLQIPDLQGRVSVSRPIVVAVVDDGFLLTHQLLRNFIYTNPNELPGNGVDDDGNGYIDDVQGYDVSDLDHDVSVPAGQEYTYYHGTMIAGVIVRIARKAFGSDAPNALRILPVKALSNTASKTYIKDGYEGIKYALTQKPDIIVCAWSGGTFDSKYQPLFAEAESKGVAIFGSAGNFVMDFLEPPASLPTVFAVAAIDSNLHKMANSNCGKKIDLSAPGDLVYAPHPIKENANSFLDGTSASVALAAGVAAVLKVINPDLTPRQLIAVIKNTAAPIDAHNPSFAGKLGAGMPNAGAAVQFLQNEAMRDSFFNPARPEGNIYIDANTQRQQWHIQAQGGVKGIWIYVVEKNAKASAKDTLTVYQGSTKLSSAPLAAFPPSIYVAGGEASITFSGKRGKKTLVLTYEMEPIDSARLYCSETLTLTEPEGTITDGSGNQPYANLSNCKWVITAPPDKRIRLEFTQFHTQPKVDFVHLFHGTAALQENLLAMFSGPGKTPVIISPGNKVLIWFVTDGTETAPGWELHYRITDEAPFIEEGGE